MSVFDVAVVGAGPAGAATALGLASAGHSVLLLHRSRYADFNAGETLCPEVCSSLQQLGLWRRFLATGPQPTHGIWSAWGSATLTARDLIASAHGTAWRLDRDVFDRMLLAASAEAGTAVAGGFERVEVQRGADGWRINAARGNGTHSFESRFVVDATGRGAAVARSCGARWVRRDRLVALVSIMEPSEMFVAAQDVFLLESAPQGWWYSSLLPCGRLVATFVTDADLIRRRSRSPARMWDEALAASGFTQARAAGFSRREFYVRAAAVGCIDCAAGPGWIAVGDAASTIDPLSGLGITKALRNAIHAARALDDAISGDEEALGSYADHIHKEFEFSLRVGSSYYNSESRWRESPFWSRRYNREKEDSMATIPRPEGNTVLLSRKLPPIDTTAGVQRRLNQAGFNSGKEDNIYGPVTTAAVQRFQQFCKDNAGGDEPRIIDSGPVDGIAGPLTVQALLAFYGS